MSRMKLFALEDEMIGGVDETTGGESAAAATVAEEVGTEVSGIEETALSVTDGIEATQELGEVKDVMDQSVEAGTGLDPVAAEMARISIRNILSKIGAESHANTLMVASESFGSTSSRLANTRYASEGVGTFISKIWEKVKIFFSNMWNKVRDFVTGLFNKEKAIKNAIDRTIKKLEDADFASGLKKITTKGKLGGFVFNSRQKLLTISDIDEFIKLHTSVTARKTAIIDANVKITADLIGRITSTPAVFDDVKTSSGEDFFTETPSDKEGPFYGGNIVESSVINKDNKLNLKGELLTSVNFIGVIDSTHFRAEETELTNKKDQIKKSLNDVKSLVDGAHSSSKVGKNLLSKLDDNVKALNKLVEKASQYKDVVKTDTSEGVDKSASREAMQASAKVMQKNVATVNRLFGFLTDSNYKLAAAVIYYAEVCMFENGDRYVTQTSKKD